MSRVRPYIYSVLFVAASTALRLLFARYLGSQVPYITYFGVIMLAAWLGGLGPGLLATVLSALTALYLFIPPYQQFLPVTPSNLLALALFCVTGVLISVLNESLRRQKSWAMQVLAGIGDGVVVTDVRGTVRMMNPVAEELTGWTLAEAKGQYIERIFTVFDEKTRAPLDNPVDHVLRTRSRTIFTNHAVLRSRRGVDRPVDDSAAPVRDPSGVIIGAVLIFRDVSDRRRLEREIESRRDQLQIIIESISDGFVALDREWRFVFVNQIAANQFGHEREELVGEVIWSVLPVVDETFQQELTRAMRDRVPARFRTFHPKLHRWYETRVFPSEIGLSVYSDDVTETKRFEDAVAELASIVESSSDAMISHDLTGVIQTWNPGAETLYGYTAEEVIGQNIKLLWPGAPDHSFEAIAQGHTIRLAETTRTRKDGSVVDVSVTISPLRDTRGRVIGATHVARDITAQKRAEEVYRESAESLRLAVRAAHMGTWRNEVREGRVTWSPELEQIFGKDPGSFPGTEEAFFESVLPEDRASASEAIRHGIETGDEFRFDFRFRKPSGEIGWMEGRGRAFRDADGKLLRLAGVGMDITARKRAEEELIRNAQQLARANADLQQFAYVASHDLQEPLRTISSFSQLLERRYRDRLDEEANEFLGYLVSGARRLSALVSDLLVYARLGRVDEVPFRPVDLNEAVRWAASNLKALLDESGARLTYDPLPTVSGEPVQLVQVLQNLIANGIKYHRATPICVHISARQDEADWIISVRDNGIGISPQFHEKIFGLFQRLHNREYSGTGIGLAICRKIVERHGGRIWVESTEGEGSTFLFTLPVLQSDAVA